MLPGKSIVNYPPSLNQSRFNTDNRRTSAAVQVRLLRRTSPLSELLGQICSGTVSDPADFSCGITAVFIGPCKHRMGPQVGIAIGWFVTITSWCMILT
jgi:hypothetical protein